jgi:hypothetical protein
MPATSRETSCFVITFVSSKSASSKSAYPRSLLLAVVLRPTAFVPPASQTEHYCFIWNGERIHQLFLLPAETKVIVPEDLMKSVSAA